ncbi:hypothetical protein BYT27DRAFT_7199754 [Phlegmacium glaucopus]|nr:hypothetical protein BYT27DRAFT_7199754 [Phlegmacium glaucopus]
MAQKALLVGGTAVISGLGGLYLIMHRNKRRQEERGTNPYHEQLLAHVAKRESGNTLPAIHSPYSNIPPAFPGKDHRSGHSTIANYKDTPEYAESGPAARNMVPPPQRGKSDGSGMAYTKSPEYVKNYGKTVRPDKFREAS